MCSSTSPSASSEPACGLCTGAGGVWSVKAPSAVSSLFALEEYWTGPGLLRILAHSPVSTGTRAAEVDGWILCLLLVCKLRVCLPQCLAVTVGESGEGQGAGSKNLEKVKFDQIFKIRMRRK